MQFSGNFNRDIAGINDYCFQVLTLDCSDTQVTIIHFLRLRYLRITEAVIHRCFVVGSLFHRRFTKPLVGKDGQGPQNISNMKFKYRLGPGKVSSAQDRFHRFIWNIFSFKVFSLFLSFRVIRSYKVWKSSFYRSIISSSSLSRNCRFSSIPVPFRLLLSWNTPTKVRRSTRVPLCWKFSQRLFLLFLLFFFLTSINAFWDSSDSDYQVAHHLRAACVTNF